MNLNAEIFFFWKCRFFFIIMSTIEEDVLLKRSRRKSEVWKYYEDSPEGERAICKACGKSLSAKSNTGTSHLKRHLETCQNFLERGMNQSPFIDWQEEVRNLLCRHQLSYVKERLFSIFHLELLLLSAKKWDLGSTLLWVVFRSSNVFLLVCCEQEISTLTGVYFCSFSFKKIYKGWVVSDLFVGQKILSDLKLGQIRLNCKMT